MLRVKYSPVESIYSWTRLIDLPELDLIFVCTIDLLHKSHKFRLSLGKREKELILIPNLFLQKVLLIKIIGRSLYSDRPTNIELRRIIKTLTLKVIY